MKRLEGAKLSSILACPECGGDLELYQVIHRCLVCGMEYKNFRNKPVLMRGDNELFHPSSYVESSSGPSKRTVTSELVNRVKRILPSRSVNLARKRMFSHLAMEHDGSDKWILVVGCGGQAKQLDYYFPSERTGFVFCDVNKAADTDVFCDSHQLPFKDSVFDGVISTAVIEHVLYPETVVAEIHRVLKSEGFLYSEVPFLQAVHEGAYDYTRFTMSGHRRLLENFVELDSGMVAGPGRALSWSMNELFKSLSTNRRVSSILGIVSRFLFSWIKYLDHLIKNNPRALDAASCTYFYGKRGRSFVAAENIVSRYRL